MTPPLDRTAIAELLARAVKGEGGCLEWRGAFDHGVPVAHLVVDGRRIRRSVRALVTESITGRRPSARCGNRACVNPVHVEWLTRSELMLRQGPHTLPHVLAIRAGKRRLAKKLNLEQAREIRQRVAQGETKTRLAREFGVHRSMVRLIETGRAWAEPSPWTI